jgi:hypothetical protein
VLQNNGGDNLTVSANGTVTFATRLAGGARYHVTVLTPPSGQSCVVTNGSGTIAANVTNVAVTCSSSPPATFTVGGSVSGLSGTVVLQNNGGDNRAVSANGAFTFATGIARGGTYRVTVLTPPSGQSCVVANGSGTIATDVTNVVVTCSSSPPAAFTVGGSVSGLAGMVVLQNNSADDLAISANGAFVFPTAVANGVRFAVTVLTQPAGQTCVVTGGSGTVVGNVASVVVACSSTPTARDGYGDRRVLVAHLKFADTVGEPFQINATTARTAAIADFFREISYGASMQTYDVKPWASLPNSRAFYQQADPEGKVLAQAAIEYVEQNYDLTDADIMMIALTPIDLGYPGCYMTRRQPQIGGNPRTMPIVVVAGQGDVGVACNQNASLMSHEIGHAYGPSSGAIAGFLHSSMFSCNTWPRRVPLSLTDPTYNDIDCGVRPNEPSATFFPYAYYDFMGSYRGHPNVFWKLQAGWITSGQVVKVAGRDRIAIDAIEVPTGGTKGVQIALGNDQTGAPVSYWVEYRSQRARDLESPTVTPVGEPDRVKVWINLPNVPTEAVQSGTSSVWASKVFTFSEFSNDPASTDLAVGEIFTDSYRGVRVERIANPGGTGLPAASVQVTVTSLALDPSIGAVLATGGARELAVTNNGVRGVSQSRATVTGRDRAAFQILSDGCGDRVLAPGVTCTIRVTHVRTNGDAEPKFGAVEWTSDDEVRTSPSVGLVGVR